VKAERPVLLDAHVHIHACYPLASFLDHAHANLEAAAGESWTGVLALTEAHGENAFLSLREAAESGTMPTGSGNWTVRLTGERISLRVTSGTRELILLAGRQVRAREDLEVLLLGTDSEVPDGLPIRQLLKIGTERRALRVIPWGAGKWFFSRGKLLSEILQVERPDDFFLGDEGGRPALWPEPRHFREARSRGIRILPGSDPLPFPREVGKAGSYGLQVLGPIDPRAPGASLLALLGGPHATIEPYGRREGAVRFFLNQIAMQLRKRRRPSTGLGTSRD
jgi:hypothetical protein